MPGAGHAVAHVFVEAALGRVALQPLAPAGHELGVRAASSMGNSRPGSKRTSGNRGTGCAGCRVKGADRVDLVVKQINAVGQAEPMGNKSIKPPRTAYSPGLTT